MINTLCSSLPLLRISSLASSKRLKKIRNIWTDCEHTAQGKKTWINSVSISLCRRSLNKNGVLERVGGAVRLKKNKEKEEEIKVKCHLKLKRRYLSRMVLGYRRGFSWLAGQVSCLIRNIPDWVREGPELAWRGEWMAEDRARAHCVCTTGAANRWLATNLEQRTLKRSSSVCT